MNTGKLNRRITIVTPGTMTPDGIGGFIEDTRNEGSISLATARSFAGVVPAYGSFTVQMGSSDLSASTVWNLQFSLDGINWDNAQEYGIDISDTLVQSDVVIRLFNADAGLNFRILFAGATTGTVNYVMTPEGSNTRDTWCSARQLSMGESLSYGLETSTASFRFSFLYFSADDITRVKELIYQSRNFRIVNIENIDEAKNVITVIANERK